MMSKRKMAMGERIVNHAIEIIYLLTGEVSLRQHLTKVSIKNRDCLQKNALIVKHAQGIISLVTGEVPAKCDDVAVYFSVEECEYMQRHEQQFQDVAMEEDQITGTLTITMKSSPGSPGYCVDNVSAKISVDQEELCDNPPLSVAEHPIVVIEDDDDDDDVSGIEAADAPCTESLEETLKEDICTNVDTAHSSLENGSVSWTLVEEPQPLACPVGALVEELGSRSQMFSSDAPHVLSPSGLAIVGNGMSTDMLYPCEQNIFTLAESYFKSSNTDVPHRSLLPEQMELQSSFKEESTTTPQQHELKAAKPYKCDECGKQFDYNCRLVAHKNTHTGQKPHICYECGDLFSSKAKLIVHQRSHTGEKPFVCSDCGKRFEYKCRLLVHQSSHTGVKPHSCDQCGKHFASKANLIVHKRSHTGEKPFVCNQCSKPFAYKCRLIVHQRTHTGEKPHVCIQCGKTFASRASLIIHHRKHTGERPYNCKECNKPFISKAYLAEHMRIHTGEKPFQCKDCGKHFRSEPNLIFHQRRHTGEKPYICNDCGKLFKYKCRLLVHVRTHTGEKNHRCNECGKFLASRSTLLAHLKTHSDGKLHKCRRCGRRFISETHLLEHLKTHADIKEQSEEPEEEFGSKAGLIRQHMLQSADVLNSNDAKGLSVNENLKKRKLILT